jgi:hypothetical protein
LAETLHRPYPSPLPERFLLQVDGAGSCLVVRKQQTTFGPTSTSRPADVEFLAQAGMPQVAIERVEDDYFLRSDQQVLVNGKPLTAKLLAHGDKISLGRRGGMKFLLPCPATTSAAVEFSGVRMPRNDTRRVILMDDAIVVAPYAAAHVRAHHLPRPLVLFTQANQLRARPLSRQGADAAEGSIIEIGRPVEVDGIAFVVTAMDGIV